MDLGAPELLIILLIGALFLALTVYPVVRAAQNGDGGWVVGIVLGWVVGLGWLVGLLYLVWVDPQKRRLGAYGRSPEPMQPAPPGAPPAGWHPDPRARHEQRYWDGARWTEHVTDQGRPGTDPV